VIDHTDIVWAMRKVDAYHDPGVANALLTEAVREIERLRAEIVRINAEGKIEDAA
jgi:hypothetical protein